MNGSGDESVLQQLTAPRPEFLADGVKVVFCVRNEKFRLPFFLDYYRKLGVNQFFAIDNNSDDDTQEYLRSQADVATYFTAASYKESNAGRDWTTEVAREYCLGRWCLTLDVDEFLVYPFCEYVDLPGLADYLDRWGYQGVFSVFLDFYSPGALSEADYTEGDSTFQVCSYFDSAQSYKVFETPNFPFLQIKGGIRQRKFWDADAPRSGPSMRKLVLIKWDENFDYLHSTHSCTAVRLADISAALAHFKFLSHLKEFSKTEVARNDRVANSGDWRVYADALNKEDVVFFDPKLSVKYSGSRSLLEDGHINCTLRYFDHVLADPRMQRVAGNKTAELGDLAVLRERLLSESEAAHISYRQLNSVWAGIGLFSQTFGSSSKGAQDLFRIEQDLDNLVNSRYWRATYPLRRIAERMGLCDQRSFPETMRNQSTYTRFVYTYRSVWWELSAPVRLVVRVIMKFLGKTS